MSKERKHLGVLSDEQLVELLELVEREEKNMERFGKAQWVANRIESLRNLKRSLEAILGEDWKKAATQQRGGKTVSLEAGNG